MKVLRNKVLVMNDSFVLSSYDKEGNLTDEITFVRDVDYFCSDINNQKNHATEEICQQIFGKFEIITVLEKTEELLSETHIKLINTYFEKV